MLDAAFKALAQMFTRPFRAVLLKSIGLAILVLIMLGIGLHRLFAWLAAEGAGYLEGITGAGMQTPLHALLWILAIAAGLGLAAGAIFIMPAVSAFVASFFSDEIAAEVEHVH
jgi:CysZ protein